MSFKNELVQMRMAHRLAKYPSAAHDYERRWAVLDAYKAPSSAASMEKLVIEFLRLRGHQAANVQTKGTHRQGEDYKTLGGVIRGKSVYTKSGSTKGAADISSNIYGIAVHWEVKYSKGDRQSPDQKKFQSEVLNSGGFYFIIRSVDEFYTRYHELLKHPLIQLNKEYHEQR